MEGLLCSYDSLLNGHKEIVELLISKGADVNAKTGEWMDSFAFVAADQR